MNWMDLVVFAAIAVILGLALRYIRQEKKKGVQCIGCPDAAHCSGHCSGCSGCGQAGKQS